MNFSSFCKYISKSCFNSSEVASVASAPKTNLNTSSLASLTPTFAFIGYKLGDSSFIDGIKKTILKRLKED